MDKKELEDLKDQELFELQNSISEVIKQRNLEKGDTDEIIDSAFDVGFRQGLEDYQKMKGQSPNIIDELSGSTEEANRARSAIFMGNMTSSDIKRLGYAEAMEFAEREEKTGADKMLRQGMME